MFIKPYQSNKNLKAHSNKFKQSFDRKKIMITKAGKTYNVYDAIQAAREDTEIYPTLKKYGTIAKLETNAKMIYDEIDTSMNLQDLYQQEVNLRQLFENMPAEERNIFENNYYLFKQNGLTYYQKKAQQEMEILKKQNDTETKEDKNDK